MKNIQNKFASILLSIVFIVLIVGGGTYVYIKKVKDNVPVIENSNEANLPVDINDEQIAQPAESETVNRLCSQKPKLGDFVSVKGSSNGEYYTMNESYRIYASDGSVLGINPVLDNPGVYYDSSGNLIGYCDGLLNENSSSFCTEILPSLTFNMEDICL